MKSSGEKLTTTDAAMTEPGSQGAQVSATAAPSPMTAKPYIPEKGKEMPAWKDQVKVWIVGGGTAAVVLLVALGHFVHSPVTTAKKLPATNIKQTGTQPPENVSSVKSIVPMLDTGRVAAPDPETGRANPQVIRQTATKHISPPAATNLGSISSFSESQPRQAPPFQPGIQAKATQEDDHAVTAEAGETKNEREAMDKPSLVFVRSNSATSSKTEQTGVSLDWDVGLAPGTRLRAKLESAVSTAVQTPVVATIEYNYEQDGEIVIPAGAKAFGNLEAADRSGYVGVRFDSLIMPDGTTVKMEAVATDLQLRPLKGKVEGKHTGKNLLIRSLSGVGEVASMMAGRGSLNQPLSESDLMRERVGQNIGQASDQEVTKLAMTEHLVITVPAETEIYVTLQKPAKTATAKQQESAERPNTTSSTSPGLQELRQLMQLQKELNQNVNAPNTNE